MEFFLSSEILLSTKLLEVVYIFMGIISIYTGFKNLLDKEHKNRFGTFIFWTFLGLVLSFGRWLPSIVNGAFIIVMTIPAIFKKVSFGNIKQLPQKELDEIAKKSGLKLFLPALSIGIFAIIFALFTNLGPLVGIGFGVLIAILLLAFFSKKIHQKLFLIMHQMFFPL